MSPAEPPRVLTAHTAEIRDEIRSLTSERDLALYGMMRQHLGLGERGAEGRGGTLVRASLCLATCSALGGDYHAALPVAAGVELLHSFSLIHEGIGEQADRGVVWRTWGEAQAINAGDGMFALARLAVHRARDHGLAPGAVLDILRLLDRASLELAEGQFIETAARGRREFSVEAYLEMAGRKAGGVMGAAAAAGGLVAGAQDDAVEALQAFGRGVGVALLLRDDVRALWGDDGRPAAWAGEQVLRRLTSFPLVYAATQPGPGAELLRGILSQPALSPSDVQEVIGLIDRSGAREATAQAAASAVDKALRHLEPLHLATAPAEDLAAIGRFIAEHGG